ncbi:MAG: TraB/GumN family protein [Oscillospiraceae bacterium]|nr:TraB/GumN family protein [Oscillospiraceae bacterium]MCL2158337.1 TraB/GumN family protein [Oscillospiraceae bacterium]MCL2158880.1 TraB/GumN family protein [Oscillospiraceae bacterium]
MKAKKILGLVVLSILFAIISANLGYVALAAEAPGGAQITDMYSPWAEWDIFMAESVYGLGNEGTYSNFRGGLTDGKFLPVQNSLSEKFGTGLIDKEITNDRALTRGEIVSGLYDIIAEALGLDVLGSPIDYFIENKLINGRASGDYQLDQSCTTEEMIAFSVRACEHLSYELGLYSNGLFWQISGEGLPNTVYLLGTVHMGDSSIYPFSRPMLEAFDSSTYLGVEANVYTMSQEDLDYMIEGQMIQDGTTIRDYISEETYELYKEVAESFGMSAEIYDYIKPWAAALNIQAAMTSGETEYATSLALGMDMFFLAKAVSFEKDIVEIESVKYQIDLFNSFSNELQELLLVSIIAPTDEDETSLSVEEMAELAQMYMAVLVEAVRTGDEATLTEMILAERDYYSDPLMEEYYTKLWDMRNVSMTETIEEYLADASAEGDFFVAVGAGHTVGETGIANTLKNKGYDVVFISGE